MPFEVDTDKLNDPKTKILDINNPPLRSIPHRDFPKMVYRHPKDKTQEHKLKLVNNQEELDAALKAGWKTKPHIPIAPPEPDADDFEAAPAEEAAQPAAKASKK